MLASEALRLVAIEVLRPTAAVQSGSGFPTLAGINVLDSREVAIQDIDVDRDYTPVLCLHTVSSGVALRGPMTDATDTDADAVLDIIGELAVAASEGDEDFAEAMASSDPAARLVLAALMAQVRFLLERSSSALAWRRLVRRIVRIEYLTFAVPELGARWQRITMRMHVEIRDDDFDMQDGGLPEPIRSVHAALPEGSYAKAKLSALAAAFAGEALVPLEGGQTVAGADGIGFEFNNS